MNAQPVGWSDVPFVLAVCETGSLSGAARKLSVNHSTVFRRIEAVEERLGVSLFERMSQGYAMTAAGEYFFREALTMQATMERIQRELDGEDPRLEGPLAVTTTDSLLHHLTPVFLAFQERYPDVELQILSGTRPLDLMQRDADIALRPTVHPPEHWIGRNLIPIAYATYAHRDYVRATKKTPGYRRWIRLVDELNHSPMNKITARYRTKESPVTVSSSLMGMFDLVCAGFGVAALPRYLGENHPKLVTLRKAEDEFNSALWILARPGLRRSAKVRAFYEFSTQMIRDETSGLFAQGRR